MISVVWENQDIVKSQIRTRQQQSIDKQFCFVVIKLEAKQRVSNYIKTMHRHGVIALDAPIINEA